MASNGRESKNQYKTKINHVCVQERQILCKKSESDFIVTVAQAGGCRSDVKVLKNS